MLRAGRKSNNAKTDPKVENRPDITTKNNTKDFSDGRVPCGVCGELFSQAGLSRHLPMCQSRPKQRRKF